MDITPERIGKMIDDDSGRQARIAEQLKYAGGENLAILGRPPKEEPDNRIPIPVARKGVRFVSGYFAKPGNIVYSSEDTLEGEDQEDVVEGEQTDYVDDALQPIFDKNDEQLTTQEEFETALTHGEAWEYHYTSENIARFVEVPVEQCIPIYDTSLPPKLVGMLRYVCTGSGEDEKKEAWFYDEVAIRYFTGKDWHGLQEVMADKETHGYGEVPFNRARIARDCSNLFDCVRPLIDFFDRIISEDFANEAQRFANSYLLLRNQLSTELDSMGLSAIDKLKITRTFEDLGDNVTQAVAFLTKNIPTEFVKVLADTFERLIYDQMQIINPNDMAVTGQISGIALAYKLLQFEYLCASMEAYFSRFLQNRIRLIQKISGKMTAGSVDIPQVNIEFHRNLPFDMASAVDMFTKIEGILPDDIALKLFPASFIGDIKKVIEDMKAKKGSLPQGVDTPDTTVIDKAKEAQKVEGGPDAGEV